MIFFGNIEKKPEENWPQEGNIEFDQVSLGFKESDPPVLNEISFIIRSKQRVNLFKITKLNFKFVIVFPRLELLVELVLVKHP